MKRLAVFFPGMGYTHDKPLLYYSRKLVAEQGYECVLVSYSNLPDKIQGDKEKMLLAAEMAYEQSCAALKTVAFDTYDEIIFVGKSIGTVIATKYAAEHDIAARLVLYTPVEATFAAKIKDAVSFIGEADPWSDFDTVKVLAKQQNVPLHTYPNCNHSLECGEVLGMHGNLAVLSEVMNLTSDFISKP